MNVHNICHIMLSSCHLQSSLIRDCCFVNMLIIHFYFPAHICTISFKCSLQLKSLVPKSNNSTFGTSEKNRFLWQNLYTCLWKTKFRFFFFLEIKKKVYLRELSGSKFHSVTSSNVILYNDVKNSIFIKSGFIWFWNWALQLLTMCTYQMASD